MSKSSPLQYYQQQINNGNLLADDRQQQVVEKMQLLYEALLQQQKSTFIKKITTSFKRHKYRIKGLYLWGSVGAGKTFLMDIFYNSLPFPHKIRIHFHKFMQQIHLQLKNNQGIANPLRMIAKQFAKQGTILCLDEFMVTDIADAMILAGLLQALIEKNIFLVFTSNLPPDELYKNGLQRQRFLPAIELIKAHNEIVHLQTAVDYRKHTLDNSRLYWYPLDIVTWNNLEYHFTKYAANAVPNAEPLLIYERKISVKKRADRVVWFNFMDLCGIPRNQDDFLFIAEHFHTVLISDVVAIREQQRDLAWSFIKLIDVLYDSHTRLIIGASVAIDHLYDNGPLSFEFARTRSRLMQMQSVSWRPLDCL